MKLRVHLSFFFLLTLSFSAFGISQKNLQAATIIVTGTGDTIAVDNFVTLREAIASINGVADQNADVTAQRLGAYGSSDAILFNIGTGTPTISVGTTSTSSHYR
jgi:hypothetical protein